MAQVLPLGSLYENYFLDYASYVILERAVPSLEDGLKPVQRRLLHAMREMHDGRFHKVANIIGQTMQYHPHGDASIGDALVNLGQKDLLVETQGNWGDVRTGDSAAASRYIEARLSAFALEVAFNPKITQWQLSYDGRKKEPIHLPVKFPMVLAQGVDGIAVGLSTKIMPHNFCELVEASIKALQGKPFELLPDFNTGGIMDASQYNSGQRGGKLRVRAIIEEAEKTMLAIRSVPYGVTTGQLIESIIKATESGKIKIKKVVDNTAEEVEIFVELVPNTSKSITIDALYAFTDCEVSISPNACVILGDKPVFLGVEELLRISTEQTMDLLGQELEIRKGELKEAILFSSLEKIFIDNRIYRDFDNKGESFDEVLKIIDKGLEPHKALFYREITRDDLIKLTEIRIKRISKYDSSKAEEALKNFQAELEEVENSLANLREFTITYFRHLLKKYGPGRERKTKLATFDSIEASTVAANNVKLYVDRTGGFVGTGLKKDEYLFDCSDLDDIIVFKGNGSFLVTKVGDKVFVGKDIVHAQVFKKGDERMTYHLAYLDASTGYSFVKRFNVTGITRDKEYDLTTGEKGNRVYYFSANPNAEAEIVEVRLTQGSKAKIKVFDYDFGVLAIKGRTSRGNILTKYPVKTVKSKEKKGSTLGKLKVWFDPETGRLNVEARGKLLGGFEGEDRIAVFYKSGHYELTNFELTQRFEPETVAWIGKWDEETVFTSLYRDGATKKDFIKRFKLETSSLNKRFAFINEHRASLVHYLSEDLQERVEVAYRLGKKIEKQTFRPGLLIDVKGWKAIGNQFAVQDIQKVVVLAEEEASQGSLF